jgi:GT2 family glycosyltransferase
MTVAVLIVNYNGGSFLRDCLRSVKRQRTAPDRIIVVDNGSSDESLDTAAPYLSGVDVIRLPGNVGFARANNIAARAAGDVDAFALLNPDASADPGWLEALVAAAIRHPGVGSFASRILLASAPEYLDGAGDSYHPSGRAWRNGHRVRAGEWPQRDAEVFAACAAAALYRREAFQQVEGFDERFFCYFEDVDLGFRLRLRGFGCLYVHDAVVRHVSSGVSGYRSDFAVYHGERNAVWTFFKNMPAPLLLLYLPQHVLLNLAALVYYPLRGQGRIVWRAKLDALRALPAILGDRSAVQAGRTVRSFVLRRAFRRGVAAAFRRHSFREPATA